MLKLIKYLITVIIFTVSFNCVIIRDSITENKNIEKKNKKILAYKSLVRGNLNGFEFTHPQDGPRNKSWRTKINSISTNYFESVREESKEGDYILDLEINEKEEYNGLLTILTGFTLYLYPSKSKLEWSMKANVKNNKGELISTTEKKIKFTLIQQLFMIFLFSDNYFSQIGDIQDDLINAVFLDLVNNKNLQ